MIFPTPHLEKLRALLENPNLPETDIPRVEEAINRYHQWIQDMEGITNNSDRNDGILDRMVQLFNQYKLYIDIELIFDSPNNFLYRQKGQLKLDNTVIEEFLPHLIIPQIIPGIENIEVDTGPTKTFSSAYFQSSLISPGKGGGLSIRYKDQDFAISKKVYLKSSFYADYSNSIDADINIAYVAAECKTNLDKTMFQEACATAHDVKSAVPGAKYFLLCEWLDMTPLSTAPTDIDEVIILRKAKRINSNIRKHYSSYDGRVSNRESYLQYLLDNPFSIDMFERLIAHINALLIDTDPLEEDVLEVGYF